MNEPAPVSHPRARWHVWLVGGVGLLWNSVGALDYFMTQTQNDAYLSHLAPAQLEVFNSFPWWLVTAWALAVWGGVLGALLLLFRKSIAVPVLLLSLLAMVATGLHNFAFDDGLYATGGTAPAFVLLIFSIALGLWAYARGMTQRGVLS